jgi:hypothetical protein
VSETLPVVGDGGSGAGRQIGVYQDPTLQMSRAGAPHADVADCPDPTRPLSSCSRLLRGCVNSDSRDRPVVASKTD